MPRPKRSMPLTPQGNHSMLSALTVSESVFHAKQCTQMHLHAKSMNFWAAILPFPLCLFAAIPAALLHQLWSPWWPATTKTKCVFTRVPSESWSCTDTCILEYSLHATCWTVCVCVVLMVRGGGVRLLFLLLLYTQQLSLSDPVIEIICFLVLVTAKSKRWNDSYSYCS